MAKRRKRFGVIAALFGLIGALGTSAIEWDVRTLARRTAERSSATAREGLDERLRSLAGRAAEAASRPQLRSLTEPGLFDVPTLRHALETEAWWQPVRSEFRLIGLSLTGDRLSFAVGRDPADFDATPLIRAARQTRQAALLLHDHAKMWPYLAGAAVVDTPDAAVPPVLVLGQPFDVEIARELAERTQGAVLLSDGKTALLEAGPERERAQLLTAIGQEAKAEIEGDDGGWAAEGTELVPGLTLWTWSSPGAQAAQAARAAHLLVIRLWGALTLGAALAFVLFRRRPAAVSTAAAAGEPGSSPPRVAQEQGDVALASETEGRTVIRPAMVTPQDTKVFGRYVLIDHLGEGGMAEVYTAVAFGAEHFRRTFVVKRLRPEMAREKSIVGQFIDEANLAASLVHSNIVPVFDFGQVGDEYFLAQEYILGRDLGRLTRRALERDQQPLTAAQVYFIAHEVLKALEYAHTRTGEGGMPLGIVHRDVSPNNILVSARGEVKLCDFGIAKAEGRVTRTEVGVVKGNVPFMSPEQARGAQVDSRADLFSLGLVMYYAIAGDVLYRCKSSYELLLRAAQGPGPEELARLAALPEPTNRLLAHALQPDPSARFQTAAELATALQPYLAGAGEMLARTMERLFSEDIRDEEARFARAVGNGAKRAGAAP